MEVKLEDELEKIKESGKVPSLLLHTCCAPCLSYVAEYLSPYFSITTFFYNPNIFPESEYIKRAFEVGRFLEEFKAENPIFESIGSYDEKAFNKATEDLRGEPEGGKRCEFCYEMRLGETAKIAAEDGFDYFATTLTVSPHKNAKQINKIGNKVAQEIAEQGSGPIYLSSDFKKKDGYKRSVELSEQYGLYRQGYCGCKQTAVDHVLLSLDYNR
ncbi:MAG: epoxyqueuosine reductase QueH [Oscillospiraceae bacterium]|nr:epoxyqueuosine reductase QueH [Oscillospiraceae bacterium]